jgi:hypothetical protein
LITIGFPVRSNQRSRDDRSYDRRTSHECGEAQPVFLDTGEAAGFLRISPITLSKWRIEGRGPAYRKFGRRVVYALTDLIDWSHQQLHQSTSGYRQNRNAKQ